MEIRALTVADTPAVAVLSNELGYPAEAAQMAERLAAVLAAPGHCVLGAAGCDGTLEGFVHVCLRLLLIEPPSAFVESLVVAEGARRHGVGRSLMAAAEDWARRAGAGVVRLRSGAVRSDAHAFYRAVGYADGKAALGFEKALN
jgi:GNAT superfamily N-acetyltransferase